MKKRYKAIWVKALRSGEYEQGKGQLCITWDGVSKYCCLGVAIEELVDADWEPQEGSVSSVVGWGIRGLTGRLPMEEREKIGISLEAESELIHMNDGTGKYYDSDKSFSEIADWIEENL